MMQVKCNVVIFDDFNNVLIAERGKGKGVNKVWGIFSKDIKESDDCEKVISKLIDKELKCTIFDLKKINEFSSKDGIKNYIFSGNIKEYITKHKSINVIKWIGKNEVDKHNFSDEEREVLEYYFKC